MFCLFGMHLEKGETRLQRLHRTHPRIYEYVMGGGEFNEQGLWIPNAKGLGFKFVMDEVNRVMGKEIYRYQEGNYETANWKQIRAEPKHAEKIIVKNCEKTVDNPNPQVYNGYADTAKGEKK